MVRQAKVWARRGNAFMARRTLDLAAEVMPVHPNVRVRVSDALRRATTRAMETIKLFEEAS